MADDRNQKPQQQHAQPSLTVKVKVVGPGGVVYEHSRHALVGEEITLTAEEYESVKSIVKKI